MKESTKTALIIIGAAYLLISLLAGSFNPMQWSTAWQQGGNAPTTAVVGLFDMNTKGYDSLDISTTLAENTNYHLYWYAKRGGWLLLGKGAVTVEVTEVDGGYIYGVVKVVSGQSYYVDWTETKNKNPRVVEVSYEDVDNDGYKECTFKFSMANIPKPATGNPTVYFYPYLLAYQQPSLHSPGNITSIGTSKVTKWVEWYAYFANAKKAYGITKVEIVVGTTDTTKVTLNRVNVPGIGYVSGDAFGTPYRGASTLTWTYSIGSSLFDANFIKYGSNQLNKFEFTTEIECQLGASDVLTLTINIYGLSVTGTLQTLTDTIYLKAGS
jgi:hypothetical protein